MATNLDSGVPELFDLTAIAADTRLTLEQRRQRIISAVMASPAQPIPFPPDLIDNNMYDHGGLRLHVLATQECLAARARSPIACRGGFRSRARRPEKIRASQVCADAGAVLLRRCARRGSPETKGLSQPDRAPNAAGHFFDRACARAVVPSEAEGSLSLLLRPG